MYAIPDTNTHLQYTWNYYRWQQLYRILGSCFLKMYVGVIHYHWMMKSCKRCDIETCQNKFLILDLVSKQVTPCTYCVLTLKSSAISHRVYLYVLYDFHKKKILLTDTTETLDTVTSGYRNSHYFRGWLSLHLQVERGMRRTYFDSSSRKNQSPFHLKMKVNPDHKTMWVFLPQMMCNV